jgi:hypothetical protein
LKGPFYLPLGHEGLRRLVLLPFLFAPGVEGDIS